MSTLSFSSNIRPIAIANIEAEESILGGILVDPEAINRVAILQPKMFHLTSHQTIYKAALDLHRNHRPTDFLTVTAWLAGRNLLEKVGGQSKLLQLVERTVSATNIDQHALLVVEKYQRRKLISSANEIIELAYDNSVEFSDVSKIAAQKIDSSFLYLGKTNFEDKERVESFKALQKNRLDLREIYPSHIAKALTHKAWKFPVHPEMVHHTFFALCSGLIGTHGRVEIDEDWVEPAIIYAASVCPSGSRKSPVLNCFKRPLVRLQAEALAKYKEDKKQYEQDMRNWDTMTPEEKKNTERPLEPTMQHYYFEDQVLEQVMVVHGEESSSRGFSLIYDELAELFLSLGQYKGGKGGDRQILLRLWNGSDAKRDRRTKDGSNFVERTSVSIFGGIQDSIFEQFLQDARNSDGLWSRFLYVNPPYVRADKRIRSKVNIDPLISKIMKGLKDLPAQTYTLSPDAKKLFDGFEVFVEDEKEQVSDCIQMAYTKMVGYLARFALILHCIDLAYGESVGTIISENTMMRALSLALFYMGQVKILFSSETLAQGEEDVILPKKLALILRDYQNNGTVTHTQIRRRKLGDSEEAKEMLRELARLGYGEIATEGRTLRLNFFPAVRDDGTATKDGVEDCCPDWVFTHEPAPVGQAVSDSALPYRPTETNDEVRQDEREQVQKSEYTQSQSVQRVEPTSHEAENEPISSQFSDVSLDEETGKTGSYELNQKETFSLPNPCESDVPEEVGEMRREFNRGLITEGTETSESQTRADIEAIEDAPEKIENISHFSLDEETTSAPQPTPASVPAKTKKEPQEEKRTDIPREAKFEVGQSIVDSSGQVIGRIYRVKNQSKGEVIFRDHRPIRAFTKKDLEVYGYQRQWIIDASWYENFTVDLSEKVSGHTAEFRCNNKHEWTLTLKKQGLIVMKWILRFPDNFRHESPNQWVEMLIESHFDK